MLVQGLFWFFAAILVIAALGVIISRNPVHSALSLVVCFVTSAAIWLLIEAEFLAVVLVLVYVGAVMVLFLFVVMMLDINTESLRSGFTKYAWLGWITAAVVIVEIVGVVTAKSMGLDVAQGMAPQPEGYSNTTDLGVALYTRFAYPFELAAVLLLVAIVAAISLTMRKRPNLKAQDISMQVNVRAQDRVRIIKMDAVKEEVAPADAAASARNPEKGA
jgi:NADH-quinone oxidoreductase subunit J